MGAGSALPGRQSCARRLLPGADKLLVKAGGATGQAIRSKPLKKEVYIYIRVQRHQVEHAVSEGATRVVDVYFFLAAFT